MLTDDPQLFLMLRHMIAVEGFEVELVAGSGDGAIGNAGTERAPVALIVDTDWDNAHIGAEFKELYPGCPAILLGKDGGRMGPRVGGQFDLVLERPFEPTTLLQFLERQCRNTISGRRTGETQAVLTYCDLLLNRAQFRVIRNGHSVELTPLQFRLLEALMRRPETVLSREELIGAAWEDAADVEPRTVDIHIGHIRRALAKYGPNLIRTVHTHGYALDRSADPLPTLANS